MPHDGVIVGHAVCSQNISRQPGALERHPDVISLGHRDVLVLHFSGVFQAADLQHEQLRLRDLADHPGEFFSLPDEQRVQAGAGALTASAPQGSQMLSNPPTSLAAIRCTW